MESIKAHLKQLFDQEHLPHAVLLSSPDLDLMSHCARWFAQTLLCESHSNCGECHACQLYEAGSHPDYVTIAPEGKSRSIKIDSIRKLSEFLHERPSIDRYRVVLIEECEGMNIYSANALLKSLEEPGSDSVLLLTTRNHQALLPTIRSRCQLIYHADSDTQTINTELLNALMGGGLLSDRVAPFIENPNQLLTDFQIIMLALIRQQQDLDPADSPFHSIINKIDIDTAFSVWDKAGQLKSALAHKVSLNPALLLEDLFIDWRRLTKGEACAPAFEPA